MIEAMKVLRQSAIVKRTAVWSALVATLLHVALLSLHVTANFERAIAAPGDLAKLSVHALCGTGVSAPLSEDGSSLPAGSGTSAGNCPICTGAAPVACLSAPDAVLAPVTFNIAAEPPPAAITVPAARRQCFAGSIRGPPALV
ncbi:MAG: hypothetical protein APF80_16915 [Alphaproteobacteria bacterium BRH_c36]|nr:MAG: hypothetical protein APF80_16915 [Alphaproteobacteria bacterium BRH_c36]